MNEIELLRQEVAALRAGFSEQAGQIEALYEVAWAANVLSGLVPRLVPADLAWDAAQTIQVELELVIPAQRDSRSGQLLAAVREQLLKRSCMPAGKS